MGPPLGLYGDPLDSSGTIFEEHAEWCAPDEF